MIPFFKSNTDTLNEKYIRRPGDIDKFLKKAMQENKFFQLSVAGLQNDAVSRIVSIDKNKQQINFEDIRQGFNNVDADLDQFAVTAEVSTDGRVIRFDSTLVKDEFEYNQLIVHYPSEIEQNTKRQAIRYKPRQAIAISLSFKINNQWIDAASLTDISNKGLGFIVNNNFSRSISSGLEIESMINVENILTFESAIKVVHTFSLEKNNVKRAGGQFVGLNSVKQQELGQFIQQMKDKKIISY